MQKRLGIEETVGIKQTINFKTSLILTVIKTKLNFIAKAMKLSEIGKVLEGEQDNNKILMTII